MAEDVEEVEVVGKRLKDLTDKLSEGELKFEDVNLEKELAILGLEFAFESNEQFKENEYVYIVIIYVSTKCMVLYKSSD